MGLLLAASSAVLPVIAAQHNPRLALAGVIFLDDDPRKRGTQIHAAVEAE